MGHRGAYQHVAGRIQGQSGLHSQLQASQDYTERPCHNETHNPTPNKENLEAFQITEDRVNTPQGQVITGYSESSGNGG